MARKKLIITLAAILAVLLLACIIIYVLGLRYRKLSDNKILIKTQSGNFIVTLYDNPTAEDLLQKLPLTLNVSDYPGYDEKVIRLNDGLSMENAPQGDCPLIPEVGYYEPGNWIAIYYGFIGYWPGKVPLGKIDASTSDIASIPSNTTVSIERYEE